MQKRVVQLGDQGGCEPRIELILKMHKIKSGGGRGAGVAPVRKEVRVVVNQELNLLEKMHKEKSGRGGSSRGLGVGRGVQSGAGGGVWLGGGGSKVGGRR